MVKVRIDCSTRILEDVDFKTDSRQHHGVEPGNQGGRESRLVEVRRKRNMQESSRPSVLPGYPVVVELPIQWGDLDAYGHVNNLVYLKWFEAARAVYAQRVGVDITPRQGGVGAVVASISCKYLRQLSYPGTILAGVRVSRLSIGSVTLEFQIADRETGVPVAGGSCDAVLYDYLSAKPVPVPDTVRAAVEELEGKLFPP